MQGTMRWVMSVVMAAVVGAAIVWLIMKRPSPNLSANAPAPTTVSSHEQPLNSRGIPEVPDLSETQAATEPATKPTTLPATRPYSRALSAGEAKEAFEKGQKLLADKDVLGAREQLSEALLSDKLPKDLQAKARTELTKLAKDTIFSSDVIAGDPYTFYHKVEAGDVLVHLERKLELHVPWQLLLKVNGMSRAEDIRSGQQLKMVRGPFHAIVNKDNFTMDVFLQREHLPRAWITRLPVGLGKNGSTPLGMWRVGGGEGKRDGKLDKPTWNPPPSSELRGPIAYGEKGYALGTKGLWIGLVGTDANTRDKHNYGIHSTSDPTSIGKEQSLGCIRLADDDIELVYSLLYEVWSTVETRH